MKGIPKSSFADTVPVNISPLRASWGNFVALWLDIKRKFDFHGPLSSKKFWVLSWNEPNSKQTLVIPTNEFRGVSQPVSRQWMKSVFIPLTAELRFQPPDCPYPLDYGACRRRYAENIHFESLPRLRAKFQAPDCHVPGKNPRINSGWNINRLWLMDLPGSPSYVVSWLFEKIKLVDP